MIKMDFSPSWGHCRFLRNEPAGRAVLCASLFSGLKKKTWQSYKFTWLTLETKNQKAFHFCFPIGVDFT